MHNPFHRKEHAMTNGPVYLWLANWNLNEAEASKLLIPGAQVTMIDTIGADADNIPTITKKVGGYDTGSGGVMWSTENWDRFNPEVTGKVQINQNPLASPLVGNVLDCEQFAWTIAQVVTACQERHGAGRECNIYVSQSNQAALEAALSRAGFGPFEVVAVQWASPSSNPDTILPGSTLTLAQANCDLSVALESWFAPVASPPPPQKLTALLVQENLTTRTVQSVDGGKTWV